MRQQPYGGDRYAGFAGRRQPHHASYPSAMRPHSLVLFLAVFSCLVACDSSEPDTTPSIPRSEAGNNASFRVDGVQYAPRGRSAQDNVAGYGLVRPDSSVGVVRVNMRKVISVAPEPEAHVVIMYLENVPGPGTYTVTNEYDAEPRGTILYMDRDCPLPGCPPEEVAWATAWSLTIHEVDATGFAAEFEFEGETQEGEVRRVTDGRVEVRFD